MRIFQTLIFGAICVLPMIVSANVPPHRIYMEEYLPLLIEKLKILEFSGPITEELAKYSMARQILEDGIYRRKGESCAGISRGEPNKSIAEKVLKDSGIKVGSATDNEGATFYMFIGPNANVYSAMVIAGLFDLYPKKFLKRHEKRWTLAKETSKAIALDPDSFEHNHRFYCILKPDKILEDCNQIYGPGSGSVLDIKKNFIDRK